MIKMNTAAFKDVYKQQKDALGSGGFGTVYKCRHRQTQQTRAVKVVPKKKIKNMETFLQEIEILKKLDHPNVVRVYEYFIDDANVYIVTEICRGGELFDKIVDMVQMRLILELVGAIINLEFGHELSFYFYR